MKTRGRAKTRPEDRSGEDPRRRADTWAGKDTSRRGQAKTNVIAKIFGRAKTLPEDRSGEDPWRREDTWQREDTSRRQVGRTHSWSRRHVGDTSSSDSRNREEQCVLNCREVLYVAASCMQVHARNCSRWHSYRIRSSPGVSTNDFDSKPWLGSPGAWANSPCPQNRRKRVVANPAPAWRRRKWSPNVALPAHVWRWLPTWHQPCGVTGCGVKTWRHLPTWRQGATLAHMASGASPDVA